MSYISSEEIIEHEWVGISSIGIVLYPLGMLVCFTTAWYYNKRYYYQELHKIGYVEKLLSVEKNLKNFKEVIRKEVSEQIVQGMTLIFSEDDSFNSTLTSDEEDSSKTNKKKNTIFKLKEAVNIKTLK